MYSIHDIPYTYPHWLYDLGLFIIYNKFGHAGIYASTMILNAILGISIYCLCNKKSRNKVVSFLITLGALYIVKGFVAARAQLVTFILFTWTVFAIEKFLETKKIRYALILIVIPLLIIDLILFLKVSTRNYLVCHIPLEGVKAPTLPLPSMISFISL